MGANSQKSRSYNVGRGDLASQSKITMNNSTAPVSVANSEMTRLSSAAKREGLIAQPKSKEAIIATVLRRLEVFEIQFEALKREHYDLKNQIERQGVIIALMQQDFSENTIH